MAIIKNYNKWTRPNKVLLILTIVFFLLAPTSGYLLWQSHEDAQVESVAYRVWSNATYGYGGYNTYSAKTDILGVIEIAAPITSLVVSGVFGIILWCRKPNDNLEME